MTTEPAANPDVVLSEAKGLYQTVALVGVTHEGHIEVSASLDLDVAATMAILDVGKDTLLSFVKETICNPPNEDDQT